MRLTGSFLLVALMWGQQRQALTLAQAEAAAAANHPRVSSALLSAAAANQVTIQARAPLYPALTGNVTGAGALDDSRLAAGGLNNPIIFNRFSAGVTLNQLVTDFGRTSHLAESARLRARAQDEFVQAARADVVLQVDRAFFSALRAQALLQVAEQAVASRQLVVDQVTALAQSRLRSELDVSFAKVNLADARLLLIRARNEAAAGMAELGAAMGLPDAPAFDLVDEAIPGSPVADAELLVQEALAKRPEIISLRLDEGAARQFAESEKALRNPTVSAIAGAGGTPAHDARLSGRYAAAGVNLSIPVFNGRLFSARKAEADLRAQALSQRRRDLENLVARDVRVALLNASTAFQRLDATRQLLEQAGQSLELARARYDLGLGSIVELSQAQLNRTAAEIADASARYDYQIQHAVLRYHQGARR